MGSKCLSVFIRCLIIYSVLTFFLEVDVLHSPDSLHGHPFFLWSERLVALIFTIEYFVRWGLSGDKKRYPLTPLAVIDLLAILPFYIGFFVSGMWLGVVRSLRILRLIKLCRYDKTLMRLGSSIYKVRNQLFAIGEVVTLVLLLGSCMIHITEGDTQKSFSTIGNCMWWCMITLTTIGYGDMYPISPAGKCVAAVVMVIGLGIVGAFIGTFGSACADALKDNTGNTDGSKL